MKCIFSKRKSRVHQRDIVLFSILIGGLDYFLIIGEVFFNVLGATVMMVANVNFSELTPAMGAGF